MTLIDTAAFFGSEECFKYLFANNAKTSIHTLKAAIIGGNFFIINTVEQNITGITNECLELAILTHSDDVADYFIDKYQLDYSYRSSLSTGNIYFFFKKYFNMGSNPNTLDSTKLNALQAATFFDFSSIVEYLIDNGGDINLEDNMGNTPLTISVFNNCELCADLLIKRGAQVDAKDMFGRTPLLIACISERGNIVKILIENKADVNYMSEDHSTPICIATERENSKIIKLLLDNGANIELTDQFQNTPLIISVKNKHLEAARTLLEYNANVNAKNKNGMTSLHFVEKFGEDCNEIFDLLIKYNANPNIKNNGGDIPLKYAKQVENSHTISILESMA
ncbi:ankyrin repeat-containing protein DDB G0279043 family [Trichomonas vaginalis G3]|uniref:ankyrin repeat-containing protein DDB G0279043 family n=1 Tax=Trichomonas vaginalis (strain ATCC PRA-98 / G3) TaxID=412133 RepID=UPI0021E5873E|nr:ankyrin repeat-containing protein DDB G0279043 family [Trichomonas vaginalis G3]KAI5511495.1 ankyrin repeat-containing protein DDB G0279043 family [Trichomonas vaginalis G3]